MLASNTDRLDYRIWVEQKQSHSKSLSASKHDYPKGYWLSLSKRKS